MLDSYLSWFLELSQPVANESLLRILETPITDTAVAHSPTEKALENLPLAAKMELGQSSLILDCLTLPQIEAIRLSFAQDGIVFDDPSGQDFYDMLEIDSELMEAAQKQSNNTPESFVDRVLAERCDPNNNLNINS